VRYAVICDVHSNLEALEVVLAEIKRRGVDRVVHLGDIVGYNANPNECAEIFMEENITSIIGNHDAAACGLGDLQWFNSAAKKALRWTRQNLKPKCKEYLSTLPDTMVLDDKILLSHGSPESRDNYILDWIDAMRQFTVMKKMSVNICFFGHSHLPSLFVLQGKDHDLQNYDKHTLDRENCYLVNFGALGQPRDGDPRTCFGIFDSDEMTVEFFRLEYDISKAAAKVEKAGLDGYLVERLFAGI
jgi:diadenosine tetraphosphatase ApaH/serine/threonine PP2A family protein phosphatase